MVREPMEPHSGDQHHAAGAALRLQQFMCVGRFCQRQLTGMMPSLNALKTVFDSLAGFSSVRM